MARQEPVAPADPSHGPYGCRAHRSRHGAVLVARAFLGRRGRGLCVGPRFDRRQGLARDDSRGGRAARAIRLHTRADNHVRLRPGRGSGRRGRQRRHREDARRARRAFLFRARRRRRDRQRAVCRRAAADRLRCGGGEGISEPRACRAWRRRPFLAADARHGDRPPLGCDPQSRRSSLCVGTRFESSARSSR